MIAQETREGRVAEYLERKRVAAEKLAHSEALREIKEERAERLRDLPPREERLLGDGIHSYVDEVKYDTDKLYQDKQGKYHLIRKKMLIGNIIHVQGSNRTRIVVTRRKGDFRFTQHQQHLEPTNEIVVNGELTPDPNSLKWVDKHPTKSLEMFDVLDLLMRWGLSASESMRRMQSAMDFEF